MAGLTRTIFGQLTGRRGTREISFPARDTRQKNPTKLSLVIPVAPTVLNFAAALPLSGALGAVHADCGSPQCSSQINVDRDELNLVLPEAINSVVMRYGSAMVCRANLPFMVFGNDREGAGRAVGRSSDEFCIEQ